MFQWLVSIYLAMSGSSGPVLCSLARWGNSVTKLVANSGSIVPVLGGYIAR